MTDSFSLGRPVLLPASEFPAKRLYLAGERRGVNDDERISVIKIPLKR